MKLAEQDSEIVRMIYNLEINCYVINQMLVQENMNYCHINNGRFGPDLCFTDLYCLLKKIYHFITEIIISDCTLYYQEVTKGFDGKC